MNYLHFAFQSFWHFVGCLILLMVLVLFVEGLARILYRFCVRMPMVLLRGWPPPHLDADGDNISFKQARP